VFRRRRPIHEWTRQQLLDQVSACFTSDPDVEEVRAAVVLHQSLDLLPKDTEKKAEAEVAEAGEIFDGFKEYVTFMFAFAEEDRVEVFMEGNLAALVYQWEPSHSLDEAKNQGHEWVGSAGLGLPFENIPGIYQAAFFAFIYGRPEEPHPTWFMWALPAVGDYVPVREFPPRVQQ
jgi:hypothetical protein